MKLQFSIKTILYSLLAFSVLVPTVILAYWLHSIYFSMLLENALLKTNNTSVKIKIHINDEVNRILTLLQNKSDPMAIALADKVNGAYVEDLMEVVVKREEVIEYIALFDSSGTELVRKTAPGIKGLKFSRTDREIIIPFKGRKYIGVPFIHTMEDVHYNFNIAVPVGPANRPIASLVVSVDVEKFWQKIQETFPAPNATTYLVDDRGALMLKVPGVERTTGSLLTDFEFVRSLMGSEEINLKKTTHGISSQDVFVTGTHLETLGWGLISEIHNEGIIEPIILKVLKVGMIMLGAMIVLWILGWMIISKLSNRLLCITCFYEKIGRGDYCNQMPLGSIFKELNVQAAGMNRMVDEIKGREEDLRESEEQTRRLVEKSLDAIIAINAAGKVVLWNPQAEIIFGWKQEQAIGLTLPDLIIPSWFVEKYNQAFGKLIESGNGRILNQRIELEALRRSGEEFPVEISVSTYDLKHEIHFFALVRDITDRKKSEQVLREVTDTLENKVRDRTIDLNIARMEAEKASKAKSSFLAVMSHEIRTPMNAILGLTYLINNTELDPVQKNYMDLIQVSGDNLLLLINDILDLSKIESGVLEIETTGFDLQEVLGKVVNINKVKAEQKGLEVIFNEGQRIAGRFVGDPLRLGQVFSNLVSNAVKFTESGSITINADQVKKEEGRAQFKVSIKDTGIGLTEEEMQGLFKPFVQADSSTTRKYGGSGLGLCISKNLLEMMGGEIRVESQKGYGSSFVFTFWLDIATTQDQKASEGLPKSRETFNPEVVRGLNILIVDDDDLNLLLAENMLAVYGVNTVTVNSGAKAIQLLEKNKFDVVLMDVQMPIMDGYETTRQIRKVNKDLPIIALTANAYKGDHEKALKSGMNGYLAKPFKVSDLLQTITNLLPSDASDKEDSNAGRSENELHDPNQASRVLVVDDEPMSLKIVEDTLKNLGAQVTSVNRGKEAIKLLQQFNFDLVFMDISGAEMDGYETTRQIRKQRRFQNLPIIALTGKSIEKDKQKPLDSGMNACLTKPFELNQVLEIAKKYLPTPYHESESLEPEKSSSSGSPADFPEISGLDLYGTFYRKGRSSDWYYGLLDKFAQVLTEIPPKILDSLTENDIESAGFWIHRLKGNSGYFGAKELCDKVCLLENEIKTPDGNSEKIEHLLEQVLDRSREILAGINHWKKIIPSVKKYIDSRKIFNRPFADIGDVATPGC